MVSNPSMPEKMIKDSLELLLTQSDAGDVLAHLHVFTAGPDAIGPLGTVDESKIGLHVYVIDAPEGDPEGFAAAHLERVRREKLAAGQRVLFAAMSQEAWLVPKDDWDEQAGRLLAQGRLFEHPKMVEVTLVYGAAADGRRWSGQRWLTGPKAGEFENTFELTGPVAQLEGRGMVCAAVLRRLVGLSR
jgi:hypothetical protein